MAALGIDLLVQGVLHAAQRHLEYVGGVADRLRDMLHPRRHAIERAVWLDECARHSPGVEGAFECEPISAVTVLLVDDVVTTGATMSDCARALKRAGARVVVGLAFTRQRH